ncbi:conjugal transfer protein TraV [Citrobacter freundii]|nr:conjugal transfer protein TraV [Citrobacter freundii]
MKKITLLLAGSALLLSGCAGVKSSFDCDATTSDTCMTMTKANQLARDKAAKRRESRLRADCLPWLIYRPPLLWGFRLHPVPPSVPLPARGPSAPRPPYLQACPQV